MLGKTRSQWIEREHAPLVNALRALWTIALDVNGQSICHRAGHTKRGTARNGVRAVLQYSRRWRTPDFYVSACSRLTTCRMTIQWSCAPSPESWSISRRPGQHSHKETKSILWFERAGDIVHSALANLLGIPDLPSRPLDHNRAVAVALAFSASSMSNLPDDKLQFLWTPNT